MQRLPSLELFYHHSLRFTSLLALKKFRRCTPRLRWLNGHAGGCLGRVTAGRRQAVQVTPGLFLMVCGASHLFFDLSLAIRSQLLKGQAAKELKG